jgi:hypothetical protein
MQFALALELFFVGLLVLVLLGVAWVSLTVLYRLFQGQR